MKPIPPLGIRGFGSIAARGGERLPEDLDPLYQPFLGKRIRKVGRYIKLAVAGAAAALQRSGLPGLPSKRTGVFLGSGLGNLPEVVAFSESVLGNEGVPAGPTQFANSVANSGAFHVAQSFGIVGPVLAVAQDELSFECALLNAQAYLAAGDLDYALVGGVDVYWPDDAAQRRRMGHDPDAPFPPGEGSGWLLLEQDSRESPAELQEVAIFDPGEERSVFSHLARHGVPAAAAPGTRARSFGATRSMPEGVRAVHPDMGGFLSESSALLCSLLADEGLRGRTLHAISATQEGMVGVVTARRRADRGCAS